jgi:hypothetical protein
MTPPVDASRPANTPIPLTLGTAQTRWSRIQSLREAGGRLVTILEMQSSPGSRLPPACREAWSGWEHEALTAITHRDYERAELALDRGVHALRHALDLVRQARLSEDVILSLLAAA